MLHAQVSVNDKLRVASSKGQTDKVLELIEAGATFDVDREGRTALHLAAQFGHADTVAALILAGCNVNALDCTGHSPLQRASAEGHVDIVQQLLKHDSRVDHQDDVHGNASVHEAAWKGYSHTLEALCKAKANMYVKNKGGFAPLHLTCQNGHNQSCRVLLLAGCRPDIKNNYGDTPLHTAARYGHAGVMRILISGLCKVSEANKNGDTALHIAVAMGRRKLTRILLEAKCSVSLQNKQGETAMDIAHRKEFHEIQTILHQPHHDRNTVHNSNEKCHKKREKDSGTSSKESGTKHKDKHKKSKHGHKVHFKEKDPPQKWSPYGCHFYPNTFDFPPPKLDSLPKEPLQKGEQYFLDLSGNICKGPVGTGYTCYCAPFFKHVEHKLEIDKQELIKHIDLARADLHTRMINLEKRTKGRLLNLSQVMQEKLASDQAESRERADRRANKDQATLLQQSELCMRRVRTELQSLIHTRLKDFEHKHRGQTNHRDAAVYRSFIFPRNEEPSYAGTLKRCKSEELLSEQRFPNPTYDEVECRDMNNDNAKVDRLRLNDQSTQRLDVSHDQQVPSPSQLETTYAVPYLETDFDGAPHGSQDSGYNAANIHSRAEARAVRQSDTRASRHSLHHHENPEVAPEFNITGPFFDTVSNEMEKWYERRLVNLEKKAEEKLLVNNEDIQGRIQAIEDQLTKLNESFSVSGGSLSGSSLV